MVVAGPEEDRGYMSRLLSLCSELGISERVSFVGPVEGDEKERLLRSTWALVAPSHSEVIGMVNLEAAAHWTPSITTRETGLLDWEDGGGVLIAGQDPLSLRVALEQVAAWPEEERRKRGERSRALVRDRYSLDVTGRKWLETYSQLLEAS